LEKPAKMDEEAMWLALYDRMQEEAEAGILSERTAHLKQ